MSKGFWKIQLNAKLGELADEGAGLRSVKERMKFHMKGNRWINAQTWMKPPHRKTARLIWMKVYPIDLEHNEGDKT